MKKLPRFIAALEEALDTDPARHDAKHPLIARDEASRQLLWDVFDPLPIQPADRDGSMTSTIATAPVRC